VVEGERQVRESPQALTLDFAFNIPERPLIAVRYNFATNVEISDVIQSTFEQYGFPCDKSRPGYETLWYPAHTIHRQL